jgi:hypothetical protein
MSTADPNITSHTPQSASAPSASAPGPGPASGPLAAMAVPRSSAIWAWALTAGVLAAAATGIVGEKYYNYFIPNPAGDPHDMVAFDRSKAVSDARNSALAYGILGGSLGLALGLGGGLARGSLFRSVFAAGVGGLAGAGGAVALSYQLMPVFRANLNPQEPSILLPLLIHGAIWSAAGAAGGLAFGLGLGGFARTIRCLIGGIVGALLGTAVFEVAVATALPLTKIEDLIGPDQVVRLLPLACVAIFAALGAAMMATASTRRPKATSQEV